MTPLFLYLLKVNIALALFYLSYRYGLRRLTFYTLNRFYLLFAIGFSSIYPLIDVDPFLPVRGELGGRIVYYLPNLGELAQESPLELWNLLTLIFWSGVAVMAVRFVLQCVSLARIHFTSVKQEMDEQDLRIVKEKINPFSFFRVIYINPLLHSKEEQLAIITHEKVHAKEWHTFDILAGELNRIFYWFNPGAWLMITAIRENLEFITDRRVLRGGTDAKAYQYSLIKASSIPYASSLANNFNFSHLKIRITMMDKKPSSELHLVKYLVLVPFVAALVLAFNVTRAAFTPPVIVKSGKSLNVSHEGDFTGNPKAISETGFSGKRINNADTLPPPVVKQVKFTPPVIVPKKGKENDSIPPPPPAGKEVTDWTTVVQSEKPEKNEKKNSSSSSTLREKVVMGYPSPPHQDKTSQSEKKKFSASPDITMIRSTPAGGKPGDTASTSVVREISFTPIVAGYEGEPLVIVDGEPTAAGLKGIDAADIASISVLKNDHATSLYGKKGENGVILITSKENATKTINKDDIVAVEMKSEAGIDIRASEIEDALYIVDGNVTTYEKVQELPADQIESISVLKDKSATDKYGKKGESGVIEITTKE